MIINVPVDYSLVKEGWFREHPGKFDSYKSMGPDGMHPQMLRELQDATARPLTMVAIRRGV